MRVDCITFPVSTYNFLLLGAVFLQCSVTVIVRIFAKATDMPGTYFGIALYSELLFEFPDKHKLFHFSAPDKKGTRDNLGIIVGSSSFKNVCCDPLLEPSQGDNSNREPQHMFS